VGAGWQHDSPVQPRVAALTMRILPTDFTSHGQASIGREYDSSAARVRDDVHRVNPRPSNGHAAHGPTWTSLPAVTAANPY